MARSSWLPGVVLMSLAVQAGCSGAQMPAPSAMLDMSQLPDEPDRRRERIESTEARPGPENRKPLPTTKLQRVETAAATAAAVVGMFFSTTPTVLLGGHMSIGEEPVFRTREEHEKSKKAAKARKGEAADDGEASDEKIDASALVPWVRLPAGEPAP